jgi:hypothetical protein
MIAHGPMAALTQVNQPYCHADRKAGSLPVQLIGIKSTAATDAL